MTESSALPAFSELPVGGGADWHRAGISQGRLRALIASGQLVRIRRGAYATRAVLAAATRDPSLRHALEVAAVRALRGQAGVASHQSAAMLFGLRLLTTLPEGTVSLTVPPGERKGGYERFGVTCHMANLPADHVTKRYACLSPRRRER